MDEQESINEELIKFAIRESISDAHKLPCSNRKKSNSDNLVKIMAAIHEGHVYGLQELSSCVSAFRESDSRGWLPLHAAAVQPQRDVLYVVLQAVLTSTDLTLEELTDDGDTSLTLAAEAGLVENVRMLLQHGASPHNTNSRNESPLLIAVRQRSYDMVLSLVMGGAFVEQVCLTKWTATHEAAKVGCPAILMLLLQHGAKVTARGEHGVTPLGIAAEYGNTEALEILIQHGGDVSAQSSNGDTVLYDAAGSGNLDCVELLLRHGANPNVASYACQLPIHRAAYEGHILVLRTLIPITAKRAIHLSGQNPIHSAADGGQVKCLELLIQKGYDVNALLRTHISENYGDLRKTPLYFAVSNGDVTCAETLLAAGANPDLDPLRCILVAIRAERYELVQLLLSYGAEVNCYFREINNTLFPTALQYSLRDPVMLQLLLNSGYQAYRCFHCCHGNGEEMDSSWTDLHNQAYQIYSQPNAISFCEFISVSWVTHLVGSVVRMLLDYVSHVNICPILERVLEKTPEWDEISGILSKPRSLKHLCRLVIRGHMSLRTLNDPVAVAAVPYPPRLKNYLTYKE
ncbi:ankyrin repeat and SOCS box protein 15b isoform X1 [Etheostoma spectabile]|uniref:ankyrin repeat and SOCS box protein 15b isoform X1 n=1 Tax=Etheostoma spectabile TaxID=54343 RepID=UPI0013AF0516|nr:ankyrin repeat and SOCS box protein 15-like isoform X1 [Etheostoma spectabile]XP_032360922.1 ankyrin repeat and SOCS box protein 15-like isoform X1 [Etheostoma spectabile]